MGAGDLNPSPIAALLGFVCTALFNPVSVLGAVALGYKLGLAKRVSTNVDQINGFWLLLFALGIYIILFGAVLAVWWLLKPSTLNIQGVTQYFAATWSGRSAFLYGPAFFFLGFITYLYARGAEGNIVGFLGAPSFLFGTALYGLATLLFLISAQSPFRDPGSFAVPAIPESRSADAGQAPGTPLVNESAPSSRQSLAIATPEQLNQGRWAWPQVFESLPWWGLLLIWGTLLNPLIVLAAIKPGTAETSGGPLALLIGQVLVYSVWLGITWLVASSVISELSFSSWVRAYLLHSSIYAWFAAGLALLGLGAAFTLGSSAGQAVLSFGFLAQLIAAGQALWQRLFQA